MYLEYFSLKRHPFRITPDPSLFFPGGTHGRGVVLDALVYGITTGEGILKVVGEVGSGKTMLCRMLEERLPPSVEIVYLANPNLTARDIVYAIAFELKLEVDSATDRLVVMQKLQNYLLQKHGEGGSVVVFVEEAQGMPLETLEEIRLLSNLETHRHKLMQIVLFGQPELDHKLQSKSIRQLRERITHSFNLDPLSAEDVREYLHFRLQQAGCPWPQLISPRAEKMLAVASSGLTRRVNILADKALLAAYADPSIRQESRNSAGEILPMVLPRHVKTAIADSGYQRFRLPELPMWAVYGSTGLALIVLAWVFAVQFGWVGSEANPAESVQASVSAQPPVTTVVNQAAPQSTVVPAAVDEAVIEQAPPATTNTASPVAVPEEVSPPAVEVPVEVPVVEQVANEEAPAPEVAVAQATDEVVVAPAVLAVTAQPDPVSESVAIEAAGIASEPNVTGLAGKRMGPSAAWLAALPSKQGYTIQLYSVTTQQSDKLEEFLEFLELTSMLETSHICVISGNSRRPEQWLVMHGEYAGLSEARRFIQELPPYLRQYQPYARNLADIACAR